VTEEFTPDERARLAPYFTNLDTNIFVLTNLPETVKGALFARYSRSAKSLRRLFLDEFAEKIGTADSAKPPSGGEAAVERAERLYARVFSEYGDDSVAQLGGAHIACEYVSNVLTKVLEWGRLMAYLEQSTRYVPYTDRLHGRWRYHVPEEIGAGRLRDEYVATMDADHRQVHGDLFEVCPNAAKVVTPPSASIRLIDARQECRYHFSQLRQHLIGTGADLGQRIGAHS